MKMRFQMRACLALLSITLFTLPALADDSELVQKAWGILNAGLKDKSFNKRHDAVHALGFLSGDAKATAIAENALNDPAPEVREAAATSLGELHSTASIPKLEIALKDKDITVVLASAHALWMLKDKSAFEIYYEILVKEHKAGPGLIEGQEAMFRDKKKLAEFAFEQGVEFNPFAGLGWGIIKEVKTDNVSPVRASAAKILAEDPDPRTGKALARTTSDKSWLVRAAVLEALAQRGDAGFIPEIEPHLTDANDRVRYAAAAAIIHLSAPPPPPATTETPASSPTPVAPASTPATPNPPPTATPSPEEVRIR